MIASKSQIHTWFNKRPIDGFVEYEFITEDGKIFYEMVSDRSDVFQFQKMHNAVTARPLTKESDHG